MGFIEWIFKFNWLFNWGQLRRRGGCGDLYTTINQKFKNSSLPLLKHQRSGFYAQISLLQALDQCRSSYRLIKNHITSSFLSQITSLGFETLVRHNHKKKT